MNKDELIIRDATFNDIPFLVETVIEAEKAGTDTLSYSTIFGLTEEETGKYITDMFLEEVDNCGISVSSFLIAEKNNQIIGAVAAWIEEQDGTPSIILKGNLLNFILPQKCFERARQLKLILNELHFDSINNTIQIGAGYVTKENRGNNLLELLINEKIKRLSQIRPDISEVYDHIFLCNIPAIRTDEKIGFVKVMIKESSIADVINYLPSNKKILLKKKLKVMENFHIRKATIHDVPFLVSTIIEAEKSGTDILSYSTVFGLSEEESRRYIAEMLLAEIDGCELSISSFFIAEIRGQIAAAVAAWIEGLDGVPSTVLKGNLLNEILPQDCIKRAFGINQIMQELHIEYKLNTIQLGLVYVASAFRGLNLAKQLIDAKVQDLLKFNNNNITEIYVQVFGNNLPAIKAYEKINFKVELVKESLNKEIIHYLPSSRKILMKKDILTK